MENLREIPEQPPTFKVEELANTTGVDANTIHYWIKTGCFQGISMQTGRGGPAYQIPVRYAAVITDASKLMPLNGHPMTDLIRVVDFIHQQLEEGEKTKNLLSANKIDQTIAGLANFGYLTKEEWTILLMAQKFNYPAGISRAEKVRIRKLHKEATAKLGNFALILIGFEQIHQSSATQEYY